MKKVTFSIMLVLCISVFCFTGCNSKKESALKSEDTSNQNVTKIHFDYQVYKDVDSLSDEAKIIVTGNIIKDGITKEINSNIGEDRDKAPANIIYTISELKVEKVIKGDVKVGDIIQIKQAGGTYNNKTTLVDGVEYLKNGNEGLFFLTGKYDFDIPCSLLGLQQGFVQFDDGKTKVTDEKLFTNNEKQEDIISEVEKSVESNAKK